MSKYTKDDIFRIVEEEDVAFIRLQFCDILGTPKNIAITPRQLTRALDNEIVFDGSAIAGFEQKSESELVLHPDVDSFDIYPWRPQSGKVARMYCDIHTLDGSGFSCDPRLVLKHVIEEAQSAGYQLIVDPEPEFFLFNCDDSGHPVPETREKAGYFDVAPTDWGENVRRDIIFNLEEMGFEVTASHHEIAPAQHEIDFAGAPALTTADRLMTFRMAVKTIAKKHGLYATFMPKPLEGINGSGLHLNIRLIDSAGKNVFTDETDPLKLSSTAYSFIAGILNHMKGITLVTNPLVNSYKRLVPGYDAPVDVTWSATSANRSAMIRIPAERDERTRIEIRSPDSTSNPYLALALCIAAGLDGVKRSLTPPQEIGSVSEGDAYHVFETLPQTMGEAIRQYSQDDFVKHVLGGDIYRRYLAIKRGEWQRFRSCVTGWEMQEYLEKV